MTIPPATSEIEVQELKRRVETMEKEAARLKTLLAVVGVVTALFGFKVQFMDMPKIQSAIDGAKTTIQLEVSSSLKEVRDASQAATDVVSGQVRTSESDIKKIKVDQLSEFERATDSVKQQALTEIATAKAADNLTANRVEMNLKSLLIRYNRFVDCFGQDPIASRPDHQDRQQAAYTYQ